jgi:hypothetical protein
VGAARSRVFPRATGVRQGLPLSPALFNVFINFLTRLTMSECEAAGLPVESERAAHTVPWAIGCMLSVRWLMVMLFAREVPGFSRPAGGPALMWTNMADANVTAQGITIPSMQGQASMEG